MKLNFCSLSSGSNGNCYYLGNEFHGILIDAGISATSIRKFLKNMDISKISPDCIRKIPLKQKFHLAGFDIEAFPVCHDAPETIGFHICTGDKTITIATDLGHICQTAAPYFKAANLLVLESNYDEQMLVNGKYPHYLKARIKSDHGHLGNHQTSAFLADIINDNLSNICLAHLSKNNNTPEIVLQTLQQTFSERGIILNGRQRITILNRNMPTSMIRLIE